MGAKQRGRSVASQARSVEIDTKVAHPARVYDFWLGGKDNFAADREAGNQALAACPEIAESARANREFLVRAVRYLAGESGVRQFLDIGAGLPNTGNTHEVAQAQAPECRILYVDNDPIVLTHARALLVSGPQGATGYLDADLRDPEFILAGAAGLLDFTRPVAVLLLGVLQLISDAEEPHPIVARLMEAVPPGSFLAISHPAADVNARGVAEAARRLNLLMPQQRTLRDHATVLRFFDGLDLVPPGVVQVPRWRPGAAAPAATEVPRWAGVGRKT